MRLSVLLPGAVALVGAMAIGCTVTAQPAYAPAPPPPPPPVAEAPAPPAPPPPDVEADVDYGVTPPPDVDAYPSVVYGGDTFYYVSGIWYRRGPRGWGRYRVEPPSLARVRMSHSREARWTREGAPRPAPPRPAPPGAAQMQRRPAPPPPR